jgi:hypothetical protein
MFGPSANISDIEHLSPPPEVLYIIYWKNRIKNMVNWELEISTDTRKDSNYQELVQEGELQNQETTIDIEHEIECPRCRDIMILLSDFDSLYYSCEECGFMLYAIKKNQ